MEVIGEIRLNYILVISWRKGKTGIMKKSETLGY